MVISSYSSYFLYYAGMWPVGIKSKKAKFIYFVYRCFIAIANILMAIFESTFVINSILSHGKIKEYNDVLFLSMTGYTNLAKFFILGKFSLKNICNLNNLICQKSFQANNDVEIKLEKDYAKIFRLVI